MVHAVEFFGAGVDVHQFLGGRGGFDECVAAGGGFAQSGADGNEQVGLAHAARQRGVDAQAHIACVERVVVVKSVLKAEGVGHRQLPVFGKTLQRGGGLGRPAAATGQHQRALRGQQVFAQRAQRARVGPGLHGVQARQRLRGHGLGQHVFGQHQHHRAGSPVHGGGKGPGNVFGNAVWVVNAFHPFGHAFGAGAKKAEVVHLLKGFAVAAVAGHIAHKQDHGGGVLKRGVHANGCVGGTRPPGHKTHAGPAGEFALGFGHKGRPALLAVHHKTDLLTVGMKTIQHRQIAFAGYAKGVGDALFDQALHQQMARQLLCHGYRLQKKDITHRRYVAPPPAQQTHPATGSGPRRPRWPRTSPGP